MFIGAIVTVTRAMPIFPGAHQSDRSRARQPVDLSAWVRFNRWVQTEDVHDESARRTGWPLRLDAVSGRSSPSGWRQQHHPGRCRCGTARRERPEKRQPVQAEGCACRHSPRIGSGNPGDRPDLPWQQSTCGPACHQHRKKLGARFGRTGDRRRSHCGPRSHELGSASGLRCWIRSDRARRNPTVSGRGVGLRRQRTEDLLGLEIVLPDGELARVGWWPEQTKRTAANPYGLGPSLLHLFTQSNLGIVAAAVVSLLPRPEAQRVLRLKFARSDLSNAIDTLRRWMAQDLVSGVLKVYDSASAASYGGAPDQHLALVCVSGPPRRVEAMTEIVRAEVVESGLFGEMSLSDRAPAAANDFVLQVVEHAYAGSPSQNEHMLRSATGADFNTVGSAGGGWIFFLAFIPFDGASIDSALTLIERVHAELGIQAGTTVNALSSDVIDLVVSIKFTPTAEATAVAHSALNRIYELFTAIGFYPYRLDVDHSHWRERLMTDSGALKLSRRIRQLLDPKSILAPGRYV